MKKIADSPNLPVEGKETPLADWKRIEGMEAVLPATDREKVAKTSQITAEEYAQIIDRD